MNNTVYESVVNSIGNTPLVKINHLAVNTNAHVFVKSEYRNPSLNIKDRIAKAMVEAAEKSGELQPGGTIIEPTSGNTGIGLASIAAAKGYRCILVMPESMSAERRTLLKMLGAEIILTPAALGMKGALAKTRQLMDEYGDAAYNPRQFSNPENPKAHYNTTGPEIWEALQGNIDVFVAGVGTGGTISGVGRYLKEHGSVRIVAVEPANSPVLSGGQPGPHKIQGIGAGFIPETLDVGVIDEVLTVSDDDAIETARRMLTMEGIPVGISSGANVHAAIQLAKRPEYAGKNIVTVAASSTERYLSTPLAATAAEEAALLPVSTIPEQYLP